jgi:hypothetical protein
MKQVQVAFGMLDFTMLLSFIYVLRVSYMGCSSQTGTFNYTGIKRGASMAVLQQ